MPFLSDNIRENKDIHSEECMMFWYGVWHRRMITWVGMLSAAFFLSSHEATVSVACGNWNSQELPANQSVLAASTTSRALKQAHLSRGNWSLFPLQSCFWDKQKKAW